MKLFHTSDRIIKKPDLSRGRANADFGHGFYMTPDEIFAKLNYYVKAAEVDASCGRCGEQGISERTAESDASGASGIEKET